MMNRHQNAEYVTETISSFLNGSGNDHDWDDFTSCSLPDSRLDGIRRRALAVELPLDDEGRAQLQALLDESRKIRYATAAVDEAGHKGISWKIYLFIAFLAFLVAVTGSDLFARMTIAGQPFGVAFSEHLRVEWIGNIGLLVLFCPFAASALICASVNKRAGALSAILIFCIALAVLIYSYFNGFQAAQHALLQQRWTAAALSVGFLPFFTGTPLVFAVWVAGLIVTWFHRRPGA
ncbi:hypothetical protein ACMT1E_04700 [Sphingomonas flavalba]|uniref:hypothetical protein n=1 Tax=Sphingomonas flavalba TaxID=2559804 RepID=UPI0039E0F837